MLMLMLPACSTLSFLGRDDDADKEPQPVLAIAPANPADLPDPPELSDTLQAGEDPRAAWARAREGEALQYRYATQLRQLITDAWAAAMEINGKSPDGAEADSR